MSHTPARRSAQKPCSGSRVNRVAQPHGPFPSIVDSTTSRHRNLSPKFPALSPLHSHRQSLEIALLAAISQSTPLARRRQNRSKHNILATSDPAYFTRAHRVSFPCRSPVYQAKTTLPKRQTTQWLAETSATRPVRLTSRSRLPW